MNDRKNRVVASAMVAAAMLAVSVTGANAGAASFGSPVKASGVETVKVGHKHGGKRRHGRHARHFGYGPYHYTGYGYPYGGCFWKKQRFYDGYGWYWKRVKVCY